MSTGCIYNIDISTNNKDIISVSSDNFDHFYIANIDDNGDETIYKASNNDSTLFANFFMVKILNDNSTEALSIIQRLSKKKDVTKIKLFFTNGNIQEFDLAKKRIVNDGKMENIYQDSFFYENDLCIMITDKKIKYKKELFV